MAAREIPMVRLPSPVPIERTSASIKLVDLCFAPQQFVRGQAQRSLFQSCPLSYVLLERIQAVLCTMPNLEVTRLPRHDLLLKAAFGEWVHFGQWGFI